jgi:DNA-binding transcriptional ArsR family regulator
LLKTLSDPTRLTIFKLVLSEELCICELQSLLGISQPAVSQHMAKLKGAGLVRERRAGMWTYYRGDLAKAREGLQAVIAFLGADLPPDLSERLRALDRVSLCGSKKGVDLE